MFWKNHKPAYYHGSVRKKEMKEKDLIVVDHTIREGMQYRGLMFSFEERKRIAQYQERLGVDICQAAYPPAHVSEAEHLKHLHEWSVEKGHHIRIAGLCRAMVEDVQWMIDLGVIDFHLHSGINKEMLHRFGMDEIFDGVTKTVQFIRDHVDGPVINLSFADVAATDFSLLKKCVTFVAKKLHIDIVNLPDTSGSMAPHRYQQMIETVAQLLAGTSSQIAVHCHNDMGMANANTVLGIVSGARVVEVTALGIGERNGIGDLYTVSKLLKEEGYHHGIKTEDLDGFKAYYDYVNEICIKKLGEGPLNYNTPVFGDAVKTHVAGTHGIIQYSNADEKKFHLNVLCGKHLVEQYLVLHQIPHNRSRIKDIVAGIKEKCVQLDRPMNPEDVRQVVSLYQNP